jgi:hypothetical protein
MYRFFNLAGYRKTHEKMPLTDKSKKPQNKTDLISKGMTRFNKETGGRVVRKTGPFSKVGFGSLLLAVDSRR